MITPLITCSFAYSYSEDIDIDVDDDPESGLFYDGKNYTVSYIRNGTRYTLEIKKDDVMKWFRYFLVNDLYIYDNNEECEKMELEKIFAKRYSLYETVTLYANKERRFFFHTLKEDYSVYKETSFEEAYLWLLMQTEDMADAEIEEDPTLDFDSTEAGKLLETLTDKYFTNQEEEI